MPIPRRTTTRRLSESTRRKLEVTSAMAWESLVDTHVEQATQFVSLMAEFTPVQESLPRYLREMDLYETMVAAIRSRVLMRVEDEGRETADAAALRIEPAPAVADGDEGEGWNLLRQPGRVVRSVMQRQRRNDEMERIVQLAIARAEEAIIRTHVENAIGFAALLEDQMPLDRAVQQYLGAVGLAGGRAQAVFQRTMARLADVHLPR
jgi:hypothetical protein